jgi:hypothetical protein
MSYRKYREMRNAYEVVIRKYQGKIIIERCKRRLENTIEMDLT